MKKKNDLQSPDDIGKGLGLNAVEIMLMKYKAEMSKIAVSSIKSSKLSVNQIVEKSGVARSKVSAVKNGATVSVSIDLLLKIIIATGTRLSVRAA